MGIFDFLNNRATIKPASDVPTESSKVFLNWIEEGCPQGYRQLSDIPEIKAGVEKIAEIISTMTIHLMKNTENGDVRIKDELSKKIDVRPNKNMSKQLFIDWVVQEMLLNGNAVAMVKTYKGRLEDLIPVPKSKRTFNKNDKEYIVRINNKDYKDQDILNFRYNPDLNYPMLGKGQDVILKTLADTLDQARNTTNLFMRNKMTPGVIVKVSALTDNLASEDGRDKIEQKYLKRAETGQPWIIPDMMDIQTIKPLTLNDIAIHETVKVSKETVAAILGIPPFLLGVGTFNRDEYNNFIQSKIAVICKAIEQELSYKILYSPDRYFTFNKKSLLSYSMPELAAMYSSLFTQGIVTGNEVRDALGMSPIDGLDNLILLENYIKLDDISKQNKLEGGKEVEQDSIQDD